MPIRFASPNLSYDAESAALRAEIMALRRRHGDADPGIVVRLARQRVAAATTILEMKAMAEAVAEFRDHLETLRLALRLEQLRGEYKANFDPAQPRDEVGRWTDGGGEASEQDSNAFSTAPDGTPILGAGMPITGAPWECEQLTKRTLRCFDENGNSDFDIEIPGNHHPFEYHLWTGRKRSRPIRF